MAAIYQWFIGKEVVLTTTLYPLEAGDAIDLTITLDGVYMSDVPDDYGALSFDFDGGFLEAVLFDWGPVDDYCALSFEFDGGLLEQILTDWGPPDDYGEFSVDFDGGLLEKLLVEIYAPDEGLDFSMDLFSISMTDV